MRKKKSTYRYDKLIELYNSGITDVDEISKKINASKNTVYVYISRAKKEGRIIKAKKSQKELPKKRPQKTKYKIVIELYNSGITDADVISKKAKLNNKKCPSNPRLRTGAQRAASSSHLPQTSSACPRFGLLVQVKNNRLTTQQT